MRYPNNDQIAWQFNTANFRVVLSVEDCVEDPAEQFDDARDVENIRAGHTCWFDAFVSVWYAPSDAEPLYLGHDSLGCCAYESVREFFTSHRTSKATSRNTLAQKALRRVICHYFPSMISEAIAAARTGAAVCARPATFLRKAA